jgi:hypothetical protein
VSGKSKYNTINSMANALLKQKLHRSWRKGLYKEARREQDGILHNIVSMSDKFVLVVTECRDKNTTFRLLGRKSLDEKWVRNYSNLRVKESLNICEIFRLVDYLVKMERIGPSIALLSTNKFRYLVAMASFELSITKRRKK